MSSRNLGGNLGQVVLPEDASSSSTPVALWGAVLSGVGVALGAFGAHALKASLSTEMLGVFETGVRYQMYHGLGLLALGTLPAFQRSGSRAPGLLLAGTVIFSGSLYLLALSGAKWLGAVTPIGGLLMLVGWGLVAWELRGQKTRR